MNQDQAQKSSVSFPLLQSKSGKIDLGMILVLVNTLAILGVLGLAAYSKLIYHRPKITEKAERERILKQIEKEKEDAKFAIPLDAIPKVIPLERFTVNIKSGPEAERVQNKPSTSDGQALHFATVDMSIEIKDQNREKEFQEAMPKIKDHILKIIGEKPFAELTSVQGRFILKNEMQDGANQILGFPLINNIFFTQFTVQ